MTPEDRLRQAMQARTSRVDPSADALHHIEEKLVTIRQDDDRKRLIILCSAAAAAVVLVAGALLFTSDGNDDENIAVAVSTTTTEAASTTTETVDKPTGTTSTTTATTGTTTATTPTTAEPTPTTADVPTPTTERATSVDPTTPIFPNPTTTRRRFDSPEALVTTFASEVVGMTAPIVGDFAQGDSRSGEVEVRGFAGGAPTTVIVRQLEDNTWFVLGAVTGSIQPDAPAAFDTVASPLRLTGAAYAFEGTVQVTMFADGAAEPVGATFVTGRGDGVLGAYEGEIEFTTPDAYGWLLYTSEGGEDGSPIEFAAVRLRFA
ncbi:MAG: hypothetical protein H0V33_11865 [Acidimicrobiia bacterium]|nr:hypothetical protein [Acidimicrobiia bacterium]